MNYSKRNRKRGQLDLGAWFDRAMVCFALAIPAALWVWVMLKFIEMISQ